MNRKSLPTLAIAALLALAADDARAQPTALLTGTVRADSSLRPLPDVEVLIEGQQGSTRTDSAGRYSIRGPAGNHVVLFRALGHRPSRIHVTLTANATTTTDAELVPQPAQELAPVDVTARPIPRSMREGFNERRALGFGVFIDSTKLRGWEARSTADIMRGSGVRIVQYRDCNDPGCPRELRAMDRLGNCYASVMLDGLAIYISGGRTPPPDFSREFPVVSLEAVEYYGSPARVPLEFAARGGQCGVVLLWTRRGR